MVPVQPGGGSIFAAGVWCPGKNELEQIRYGVDLYQQASLIDGSGPTFVTMLNLFEMSSLIRPLNRCSDLRNGPTRRDRTSSEAKASSKWPRKVLPRTIRTFTLVVIRVLTRYVSDIDLLKCRSFAVVHQYVNPSLFSDVLKRVASLTDEQVLAPAFKEILGVIAEAAKPFVHRSVATLQLRRL